MKETIQELIVRIDERLNNLLISNDKEHKELAESIRDLILHVNHENELMDCRVKAIEKDSAVLKITLKTFLTILGTSGAGTATVIAVAKYLLGVI
jgi:hypothetical protein